MLLSANNADDFDAIDKHIRQAVPKTDAASKIQQDFIKWSNGVTWLGKGLESNVREAVNRRNAFWTANSVTPQELNQVREVLSTGVSREEMQGKPRVTDSAGNYTKAPGITVASAAKGSVLPGARPVLRQGMKGDAVKAWQAIIGVAQDGSFGPNTTAATKAWQKQRGLVADGIVGSASWSAALKNSAPNMPMAVAATTPVAPAGVKASKAKAGQVVQTASVTVKEPTKPAPAPTVAPVVATAATKPAVVEAGLGGTIINKVAEAPWWVKGGMVLGAVLSGKKLLKFF